MPDQNGQQPDQQPMAAALVEEAFGVETLNVIGQETQPGVPPSVAIRLLVGPLAPGLYLTAKVARIAPDLAIQLGEHLVREGQRVKTDIVIPGLGGLPADLRDGS